MNKSLKNVNHSVVISHYKLRWMSFLQEAFLGIKAKTTKGFYLVWPCYLEMTSKESAMLQLSSLYAVMCKCLQIKAEFCLQDSYLC